MDQIHSVGAESSSPSPRPVGSSPSPGATVVPLERGETSGASGPALVVGFDLAPASVEALRRARDLGCRLGANLHVVHAVDLGDYPVDPDADDWEEGAAASLEEERRAVRSALAGYPGGWSYVAVRAEPAEALDRVASEVDALMIVVGVRSGSWRHVLDRLTGPAVSQRLIHHGRRPVLVVTHHET